MAAVLTARCKRKWLAPLPPVVCNGLLVGGMLAWYEVGFTAQFAALFAVNALWVGIGEAVVCYVLGLLLIRAVPNVSYLRRYVPESRRWMKKSAQVS